MPLRKEWELGKLQEAPTGDTSLSSLPWALTSHPCQLPRSLAKLPLESPSWSLKQGEPVGTPAAPRQEL